jgi:hypothetical protein
MGESEQLARTLSAITSEIGRCDDGLVSGAGKRRNRGTWSQPGRTGTRRQALDASCRSLERYDDWRSQDSDADPAPPAPPLLRVRGTPFIWA